MNFITEELTEQAIMVGVRLGPETHQLLSVEDSLQELEMLAETAGIEVVGSVTQSLKDPIHAPISVRANLKN